MKQQSWLWLLCFMWMCASGVFLCIKLNIQWWNKHWNNKKKRKQERRRGQNTKWRKCVRFEFRVWVWKESRLCLCVLEKLSSILRDLFVSQLELQKMKRILVRVVFMNISIYLAIYFSFFSCIFVFAYAVVISLSTEIFHVSTGKWKGNETV